MFSFPGRFTSLQYVNDVDNSNHMHPTPRSFIKSIIDQMLEFQKIFYRHTGLINPTTTVHKEYISLEKRLKTFEHWPIPDIVKPEDVAKSGFYYTGISDIVDCYHCDISLAWWRPNDIPDVEHKKFSNDCEFLLLKNKKPTGKSAATCTVCLDAGCHYALTPCGHVVVCHDCVLQCNKCPVCVQKITGLLQIFF